MITRTILPALTHLLKMLSFFGIFSLLFISPEIQSEKKPKENPSQLSIALLKAKIATNPENDSIRLELVRQLALVGEFEKSLIELNKIRSSEIKNSQTYQFESLRVYWGKYIETPENNAKKNQFLKELNRLISTVDYSLAKPSWSELGKTVALGLNKPNLAIPALDRLISVDKDHQIDWMIEAGDWSITLENYTLAESYYSNALNASNNQQQKDLIQTKLHNLQLQQLSGKDLKVFCDKQLRDQNQEIYIAQSCLYSYVEFKQFDKVATIEKFIPLKKENVSLLKRFLAIYLGQTKLTHALLTAENLEKLAPKDIELQRQLAQLYDWTNQPNKALNQWNKVYQLSLSKTDLNSLNRLSQGLYAFDITETSLKQQLQLDSNDIQTLEKLAQLKSEQGIISEALDYYNRLEVLSPLPSEVILKKQRLLNDSEMYEEAIDEGQKAIIHHPKNTAIKKELIKSHYFIHNYTQAFDLLTGIQDQLSTDDDVLLVSLIELGLYTNNLDVSINTLSKLTKNHSSMNPKKLSDLHQQLFDKNLSQQQSSILGQSLITRWKETKDIEALRNAINYSYNMSFDTQDRIYAQTRLIEKNFINDTNYLSLAYQYHFRKNNKHEALTYINLLHKINKNDSDLYETLLWENIALGNTHALKTLLKNPLYDYSTKSSVMLAQSAAYDYLGESLFAYEQFTNAFTKKLQTSSPELETLVWLYYLSDYQERHRYKESSKLLRAEIYSSLENLYHQKPNDFETNHINILIKLRSEFSMINSSLHLLESSLTKAQSKSTVSKNSVVSKFSWFQENQLAASFYWLKNEERHQNEEYFHRNFSQLYIDTQNKKQLEKHSSQLTEKQSISTKIKSETILGNWKNAKSLALEAMTTPNLADVQYSEIQDIYIDIMDQIPQNFQISLNEASIGSLSVTSIEMNNKSYFNFNEKDILYSLNISNNELESTNFNPNFPIKYEEISSKLTLTPLLNHSCKPSFKIGITSFDDLATTTISPLWDYGLELNCSLWQSDRSIKIKFHENQVSYDSERLRTYGRKDILSFEFHHPITTEMSSRIGLAYQNYHTLDGDAITQGLQLEGETKLTIFSGYEYLHINTGFQLENNTLETPLNLSINNLPDRSSSEDWLKSKRTQLHFETEYGMGQSDLEKINSASFRFKLNSRLSYDLESNEVLYDVTGFMGQRLFKNDELGILGTFSTNINNEDTHSINISYRRFF